MPDPQLTGTFSKEMRTSKFREVDFYFLQVVLVVGPLPETNRWAGKSRPTPKCE